MATTARRLPASDRRLPRGRHGLPREAVTDSQRTRIQAAMVAVVAEHGYAETRVVDLIGHAGVSRKTFYELFESKEDCFLDAYDLLLGRLLEKAERGFGQPSGSPWSERVEAGMRALLAHLAARPSEARFAIVEVFAAGPKALARRDAALRQFAGFVEAGRSESDVALPGCTAMTIVGGVSELVYSELLHGAAARLPGRLPELVFLIVLPFLGPERAAVARERARDA